MQKKFSHDIVGLLGYPVEHSLSPYMHNLAFKHLKLQYQYVLFSVRPDNVQEAVQGIRAFEFKGVNVTMPHKVSVMAYLDEIREDAQLIGAVNTIHNSEGRLIGYNTDGEGFLRSLSGKDGIEPKGKKVLLIGAGGAGRALAMKLVQKGVEELVVVDKFLNKAEDLIQDIRNGIPHSNVECMIFAEEKVAALLPNIDILVNATPIGMHPEDPLIIKPEWLHNKLFVYDVIYSPLETKLLKVSKEKGLRTKNGLEMLLCQGAIAFEIWTGKEAPLEIMREALLSHMS